MHDAVPTPHPAGSVRRRLAGTLAAAAVGLSMIGGPAAPAQAAAAAPGGPVPDRPSGNVALTWAPLYMSDHHEYTRAEALRLADRFDLVSAMPYGLKDHSSAMRRANPDLDLLAYSNATLALPKDAGSLPENAFAHDTRGRRIKAVGWNTFLMEADNKRWQAVADRQCADRVALGGFDGCLVDMLTLGIFAKNNVTSQPVNPDTGRLYTEAEYRADMIELSADLRRLSPNLVQVGNIVENGYRYWDAKVTSRPLALSTPGAQMEDFLRGAHDPSDRWPTVAQWKKSVDVVTDFERNDVTGLFTTKIWSGANKSLAARWQAYSMASFLMGANGDSFFAFTQSRDKAGASQTNVRYTMPDTLGLPQGAMHQVSGGAWVREFAGGQALVNPGNSSVRVSVSGVATKLDGSFVNDEVLLPPHSGEVLVGGKVKVLNPASLDGSYATKSPKAKRFKLAIKTFGGRTTALRPRRWTRVKARVANRGSATSPRGRVKVVGRGLRARNPRIRALAPGRATTVKVKVKLVRRTGPRKVRLVYRAGGKRDITIMRVRARR